MTTWKHGLYGAILAVGVAALLSIAGCEADAELDECKGSCDSAHVDCTTRCHDDSCRTQCDTTLDDCEASCDEIDIHTES